MWLEQFKDLQPICRIPQSFHTAAEHTSGELPSCLDHPALRGSLVMLPGIGTVYGHDLPTLPEPHLPDEDYPFTHEVPASHVHVS